MSRALALGFLLAAGAALADGPDPDWLLHGQATIISQAQPAFPAAYTGPNSLSAKSEDRTSFTSTAFLGRRLWSGAELHLDPEATTGLGLSGTHGAAGFPNGDVFRVSDSALKVSIARAYLIQKSGGATAAAGKFSLVDYLDDNAYSHDPRTQFMNWALFANAAWDYAADTRGYTYGLYAEYARPGWAVRGATALMPTTANGPTLDTNLGKARGDYLEGELRYAVRGHPGKARLLAWANQADMGSYRDAIEDPAAGLSVARTRAYRTKYGFGLNLEQELSPDLGIFSRLGWDDGATETFAFTEADRTASLGLSLKGGSWGRKDDVVGLAGVVNGLSADHRDYLAAGGLGFMLGDGALKYGTECILEAYYLASLGRGFAITLDFQELDHPGYNRDRGPASVFGVRLHWEI